MLSVAFKIPRLVSPLILTLLVNTMACTSRWSQSTHLESPQNEPSDTDLKLAQNLKLQNANTSTRWLQYGMEETFTESFVQNSILLFKRNRNLHTKTYLEIANSSFENKLKAQMLGLIFLDTKIWVNFVNELSEKGFPNQGISNSLPPLLKVLSNETKTLILQNMGTQYTKAYRTKFTLPAAKSEPFGDPMAPKRALDAVLRCLVPLEEYFVSAKSPTDYMVALNQHLEYMRTKALNGSDHGQYLAEDIIGVSQYIQNSFRKSLLNLKFPSNDPKLGFQQLLLKGSFPSGRANLVRRSPWDNPIDTILHGVKTSYSDIDLNVGPSEAMAPLKDFQSKAWSALSSTLAKDQVIKSKAQADFQMHPRDPYGELHGSRLSPVGVRITPTSIKLVVYKQFRLSQLPSKRDMEAMDFDAQEETLKKFSTEYDLSALAR